jgi:hypothetical protein
MRPNTSIVTTAFAGVPAEARVAAYDWEALAQDLDGFGCAVLPKLLSPVECRAISSLYSEEEHFRSHVHMARHGFGKGEYRYFKYPLPPLIGGLRTTLYPHLANIANGWNERMGIDQRHPELHAEFLKQCHAQGQTRPTPLLLQYVPGTSTACIRIFTVISHSRCRLRSCSLNPEAISQAASLFLPSSGHACRAGPRWCRCGKVMRWPSPCTAGRSMARKATIASISDMASAGSAAVYGTP